MFSHNAVVFSALLYFSGKVLILLELDTKDQILFNNILHTYGYTGKDQGPFVRLFGCKR